MDIGQIIDSYESWSQIALTIIVIIAGVVGIIAYFSEK